MKTIWTVIFLVSAIVCSVLLLVGVTTSVIPFSIPNSPNDYAGFTSTVLLALGDIFSWIAFLYSVIKRD